MYNMLLLYTQITDVRLKSLIIPFFTFVNFNVIGTSFRKKNYNLTFLIRNIKKGFYSEPKKTKDFAMFFNCFLKIKIRMVIFWFEVSLYYQILKLVLNYLVEHGPGQVSG